MELDEFRATVASAAMPDELSPPLQAMWAEGRGDWEQAHMTIQYEDGDDAAWVHAYLHRKEGDASNAAYWYSRAGRPICRDPLQDEWEAIITALLGQSQ